MDCISPCGGKESDTTCTFTSASQTLKEQIVTEQPQPVGSGPGRGGPQPRSPHPRPFQGLTGYFSEGKQSRRQWSGKARPKTPGIRTEASSRGDFCKDAPDQESQVQRLWPPGQRVRATGQGTRQHQRVSHSWGTGPGGSEGRVGEGRRLARGTRSVQLGHV